jgi:hypothetical protein
MASKDEGLGRTLLREVELGIEQAGEFSQAMGRAATRTWTLGLRATVAALEAATTKGRPATGTAKSTETIRRLGAGLREFARQATVGYSAAVRDGMGSYGDALKETSPTMRKAAKRPKAKAGRSTKVAKA